MELVPAHTIPVTTSPDGKCTLRILGALAGRVEWYELAVEPGGVLASEPHEAGAKEHLSVLSGSLTVQAADSSKVLKAGDSARYAVDVQHAISNSGQRHGQGGAGGGALGLTFHIKTAPSARVNMRELATELIAN